MNNPRLKHQVKKEIRQAGQHLRLYLREPKPEHIHHLRIALKKVKAACSFSRAVSGKDPGFDQLRPLFRSSGSLRNIQVYKELLSTLKRRPAGLLANLEREETTLSRRFKKRSSIYLETLRDFGRQLSLPLPHAHPKRIRKYFQKKEKKVKKLLDAPSRRTMHSCRKELKRILYLHDMLPSKWKKQTNMNRDKLDALQVKAGHWHDTYAVLQFGQRRRIPPRQFPSTQLKTREKRQFREISREYEISTT